MDNLSVGTQPSIVCDGELDVQRGDQDENARQSR
jgi:hypothetical protein